MNLVKTKFDSVWVVEPKVFRDERGFFLESYSKRAFTEAGISTPEFVQDNHSLSRAKGVVRGLHFQNPPHTQTKLVRVTAGGVYDVVVDIRKNSPTYGVWEGFELTAENFRMLYVPAGFAHGFCTTQPDTEVLYKVDKPYMPEYDSGLRWNDPTLSIDWQADSPILSEKDSKLGLFVDFTSPF